jgi:fatty acid desaturase
MVAFVMCHYGLATYGLLRFHTMSIWQILLVFVGMCMSSFIMATVVHNAIHAPIFKNRILNKAFQMVLSVGQGHPMTAFVPGHNMSHHMHVATRKDIMRPSQVNYRSNFLNQLLFSFKVLPDLMDSEKRWAKKMRKEHPVWFWQYVIETALVYTMRISLLIYDFPAAVIFVAIPHFYGHWGVLGANYYQHDGCDPDDEVNHSRTFTGWLLNFVLFNNGYHAAHHMNPGVHWSLLPKYHAEHVAPRANPALIQRSILAYLWKTCIWPAKRLDLAGAPVVVQQAPSIDWIAGVDALDRRVFVAQLGADRQVPPTRASNFPVSTSSTSMGSAGHSPHTR